MKNYLIVANWKLNGNIEIIDNYLKFLKSQSPVYFKKNIIVLSPPTIYLERVFRSINDMNIFIGSQDVDMHLKGAYTGETSILMLHDIGVKYVIIGHSERRLMHNESNDLIAEKFSLIKKLNLTPILCIGETKKDRQYGRTKKVIKEQLNCILKKLGKSAFRNTVIAYEPIWAIGTGESADPEDVQLIHEFIKNYIKEYDSISMENIIVQYGGSVNCLNTQDFIKQPDIDGLLIGSASLQAKEFFKIIKIIYNIF